MNTRLEKGERTRRILVIDDEEEMCLSLKGLLEREHFSVNFATSAKSAFELMQENIYNLVICDIRMPEMGGIAFLSKIGAKTPVIMITAYASVETARKAFKLGARDYLTKPFKFDELLVMVKQFVSKEPNELTPAAVAGALLRSNNEDFVRVCELAKKFSPTDIPILITGESGTGKEVLADYIRELSSKKAKPYVKINCAAIPESLLEAELFGYEKGAYTGAVSSKVGKIEEANGGILFLDEIGDMPMVLQAKMLRVLQDFRLSPLGSNKQVSVSARIIAASNCDLEALVERGQFRLDLYHRLCGVHLHIPPLRDRKGDIRELTQFFLAYFNAKYRKRIVSAHEGVFKVFDSYSWPGNIRELKYAIERGVVVCDDRALCLEHLPDSIFGSRERDTNSHIDAPSMLPPIEDYRHEYLRRVILEALSKTNGNKVEAAKMLNISRKTLYNRIKELNINIKHEFV